MASVVRAVRRDDVPVAGRRDVQDGLDAPLRRAVSQPARRPDDAAPLPAASSQRGRPRLHPLSHQPGAAGECRAATGHYEPLWAATTWPSSSSSCHAPTWSSW